ncbi:hypothetical protein RFI_39562, partial [Reticulomyxa filosa]
KKKEKEVNIDQNKIKTLTTLILKALLKNRVNRVHWIELLEKPSKITSDSTFNKFLEKSFKDWLGSEEKNSPYEDNNTFPSKVIELLCSSVFLEAKLYHAQWIEIVDRRSCELQLDNSKWTSDDIDNIRKYAKADLQLWEKAFRHMDNIPSEVESDAKKMETTSDEFSRIFEYCLRCSLWFRHESPMQPRLFSLLGHTCTTLSKHKQLFSIMLCKFLSNNLQRIHDLLVSSSSSSSSSSSTELKQSVASLDNVVQEYKQFSESINRLRQMQRYLVDQDLPATLKVLVEESSKWEHQSFVQVEKHYEKDLGIFAKHKSSVELVLRLQQSVAFNDIWGNFTDKYKTFHLPEAPFSIFERVFEESKREWDHYRE